MQNRYLIAIPRLPATYCYPTNRIGTQDKMNQRFFFPQPVQFGRNLTHPTYRPDIDGLRAIAVLSVIGFHAFPNWIRGGSVGVDIFFVISGYLISSILLAGLESGSFRFKEFYSHRIRRIFPALILVLFACFLYGWFTLFPDEYKQLGKHIFGGTGFISNFFLWQESGYFDNTADTKPLLHLWSLGIEEQFYIVWPLLLYAASRLKLNFLWLTLIVLVISFSLNVAYVDSDTIATFYSPATRFWELSIGSVLAYLTLNEPILFSNARSAIPTHYNTIRRDVSSVLGAILIAASVYLLNKDTKFPGTWALLPTIGTYLIISAGRDAFFNRNVLSHPILIWFGLISYPLYLWHWPLLSFARIVESATPSFDIRITAVAISIALAWLTYKLVEKPIRFGKNGKNKVKTLCVLMAVVSLMGYTVYYRDGIESRTGAKVASSIKFDMPYRERCDAITHNQYGDDRCHLSESSENDQLLIIGDSHANAFSSVFSALRLRYDFSFSQLGRGQCPLLVDYGYKECKEIADIAVDIAKRHNNIKSVALVSRWPLYRNGFARGAEANTEKEFEADLERTIRIYTDLGKNVILVLAVPQVTDPRSCVYRPAKQTKPSPCNISIDEARGEDGDYREFMKKLQIQFPDLRFFEPWKYLCGISTCKIIDGNEYLYADSTHISVLGGKFLASHAEMDLENLFGFRLK